MGLLYWVRFKAFKKMNVFVTGGYIFLLHLTYQKEAVITSQLHQKMTWTSLWTCCSECVQICNLIHWCVFYFCSNVKLSEHHEVSTHFMVLTHEKLMSCPAPRPPSLCLWVHVNAYVGVMHIHGFGLFPHTCGSYQCVSIKCTTSIECWGKKEIESSGVIKGASYRSSTCSWQWLDWCFPVILTSHDCTLNTPFFSGHLR